MGRGVLNVGSHPQHLEILEQKKEGRGDSWVAVWVKASVIVACPLRPADEEENVLAHIPVPPAISRNGSKEPELGDCPTKGGKLYPSRNPKRIQFPLFPSSDFRSETSACSCFLRPEIPLK